jgi:hypothetical protein
MPIGFLGCHPSLRSGSGSLGCEMLRGSQHGTFLSHSGKQENLVWYNFPIFEAFHVQKGFLYCKIETGEVYLFKVFF